MDRLIGQAVKVTIGKYAAWCPNCAGESFVRKQAGHGSYSDTLICAGCEAETNRAALVEQLAEHIIRENEELLAKLKALRNP